MKTKLVALAVVVCLVFSLQATEKTVLKGKTFSELGSYEVIKTLENAHSEYKTFIIKYANCDETFTVRVCKGEKCKNFVVYGNDLELLYKAHNNVFGMTKMEKRFCKFNKEKVVKRINREQYHRQKVICATPKTETEYLGLIACYLPEVLVK